MKELQSQIQQLIKSVENAGALPQIEKDILLQQMAYCYQLLIAKTTTEYAGRSSDFEETVNRPLSVVDNSAAKTADQISERVVNQQPANEIIIETKQPLESNVEIDPNEILEERVDDIPPNKHDADITVDDVFIVEEEVRQPPERDFLEALGLSKKKPQTEKDIRSIITINERLYFINVLFGGDEERYHMAMEQLNGQENENAAKEILQNLIPPPPTEELADEQQPALELLHANIKRIFTAS